MKQSTFCRIVIGLVAAFLLQVKCNAQTIIVPKNDSTFISEFRNGDPWAIVAKNGFVVGLSNKSTKDDYGKYYQINVMIQNLTGSSYTFIPDKIHADLRGKYNDIVPLEVYTNEAYQKKVKRSQSWTSALYALSSESSYIQMRVMDKQMEYDRKIREEGYLKKTTIHSGEGICGYMNIKRVKGKTMRIIVPINGTNYVFDWDVSKKKK